MGAVKTKFSQRVLSLLLSILLCFCIVISPICESRVYAVVGGAAVITVIAGAAVLSLATSAVLVGLGFVKTDDTSWAKLVDMIWYNQNLMDFKSGVVSWVKDGIQYIDEKFIKSIAMAAQEVTQFNPATFLADNSMNIPGLGKFPVVDITGVNKLASLLFSKLDSTSIDMINIRDGDTFTAFNGVKFTITDYDISDTSPTVRYRRASYITDYDKGGVLKMDYDLRYPNYLENFPVQHDRTQLSFHDLSNLSSEYIFLEPHYQYDKSIGFFKFYFNSYLYYNSSGVPLFGYPTYKYYYNDKLNVLPGETYADIVKKNWLEDASVSVPFGVTKDLPNVGIDEEGKAYANPPLAWNDSIPKASAPSIDYPLVEGRPIVIPKTEADVGSLPQDKVQSGDIAAAPDVPGDIVIDKEIDKALEDMKTPPSLNEKFPFSIPFDVFRALKTLSVPGVAPVFVIPLKAPEYGLNFEFKMDWTGFEVPLAVVRWGTFLVFLLGLALGTKKLIWG